MLVTVALLVFGVLMWMVLLYLLWITAGKFIEEERPTQISDVRYDAHPEFIKAHHQGE